MINGTPLFTGTSETTQLDTIFKLLGTPDENINIYKELPDWRHNYRHYNPPANLSSLLKLGNRKNSSSSTTSNSNNNNNNNNTSSAASDSKASSSSDNTVTNTITPPSDDKQQQDNDDDEILVELLSYMLEYDPSKRISAQEARKHAFFHDISNHVKSIGNDMT